MSASAESNLIATAWKGAMTSLGRHDTSSPRLWHLKTWTGGGALLLSLGLLVYGIARAVKHGVDFRLRYNESMHIRSGIDPFDVYVNGAVGLGSQVNVHVPWTYWFMEAFTYPPYQASKLLYTATTVAAFFGILWITAHLAFRLTGKRENILPAVGLALCNWQLAWLFFNLNFGLHCALGAGIMIVALNAKRDVIAGLGFFLVMLKPQLAILMLIPLFLKLRIKTITVAAVLCTLGLLVVSFQLSKAPWTLLFETLSAGKGYLDLDHFKLFSILYHFKLMSGSGIQILQLSTGALVTALCCWRARHCDDWYFLIMPAIVCALFSFYGHRHDQVVLYLFILLAVLALHLKGTAGGFLLFCYMVTTVMTPSLYTKWNWGGLEISIHNLWRYGSWICILLVFYFSSRPFGIMNWANINHRLH